MIKMNLKSSVKKIDSPLAKYSSAGQLFCVLCNVQVKSEMFWTGHVNGRSHQDAIQSLKSKNKRPQVPGNNANGTEDGPSPKKKALTVSSTSTSTRITPVREIDRSEKNDNNMFKVPAIPASTIPTATPTVLIASTKTFRSLIETNMEIGEEYEEGEDEEELANAKDELKTPANSNSNGLNLPEGFFDDPKEDAKIRGKEWRDPEEVEWERFTKEIANEELKSSNLRIQDDEDSTKTRELEEIEEQMAHWQKVIDLERKAEQAKRQSKLNQGSAIATEDDDGTDEYDEEMDWRSKRH